LKVRWYFAVDIPKRKPKNFLKPDEKSKPLSPAKKYAPFTVRDSRNVEQAFQRLAKDSKASSPFTSSSRLVGDDDDEGDIGTTQAASSSSTATEGEAAKVPVNEDYLFDVDIDRRELAPAYWLGPVYDVRRATWFYDSGSSNRPCEENLALQLEEGFVKAKPWRYDDRRGRESRSASQPKRPSSWVPRDDNQSEQLGAQGSDRAPSADRAIERSEITAGPSLKQQLQTHRLFGTYMNSIVTYQDATTAYILTDDFMSRMSSTMYERFAGGAHLGGVKVVRGFTESNAEKTKSKEADNSSTGGSDASKPNDGAPPERQKTDKGEGEEAESTNKRKEIARQISNFVSPASDDSAINDEEIQRRQEREMQDDYREEDAAQQNREIEHLVLVTHGIGQRLGMKLESLNFIHDVNTLRKTLKSVYEQSPDLQALNMQVDSLPKNSRIQVLPIAWRHLLDFPHQNLKQRKKERDLSDPEEELEYPKLNDITIEGVAPIRNLIEDLFLDILLYQSTYREHIGGIVQTECNRVYKLFVQRNPNFKGKVSMVGHSLGSAIFFDLLCRQKDAPSTQTSSRIQSNATRHRRRTDTKTDDRGDFPLDFPVEDMYCLGSPIALFEMLKGQTIAGRRSLQGVNQSQSSPDPFGVTIGPNNDPSTSSGVSSPKCAQLYNIFFPTDPIAYRLEPLISPAMSSLKPQPLPYVKKGMFSAPGLQGIGNRVGQSVSGLWSSMTTGLASTMLSRTLGMESASQASSNLTRAPLSMGAGTNISAGTVSGPEELEAERKRRAALTENADALGIEYPPTLIDGEIETLYAGFEKRRQSFRSEREEEAGTDTEWKDSEDRARQFRREEAKVRALNSNGRVDFSIQDSILDISLISSITSHLAYWTDEDFSHFMVSQLLSRQRVMKR